MNILRKILYCLLGLISPFLLILVPISPATASHILDKIAYFLHIGSVYVEFFAPFVIYILMGIALYHILLKSQRNRVDLSKDYIFFFFVIPYIISSLLFGLLYFLVIGMGSIRVF
jgi:hypothetical protein